MLIISDFHDYYDSVSSLGIDKQCPYQRKEEKIELKLPRETLTPSYPRSYSGGKHKYELKYRLIGFCGAIYPVVEVVKSGYGAETGPVETLFFYDKQELMDYLTQQNVRYKQYRGWWWRNDFSLETNNGLDNFFNPINWSHFLAYFRDRNTPTFLVTTRHLIVNPILKKYRFQRVKDPYSAFQEIYMYISGVLGVDSKPTVQVSDEVKAAAKGHDGEYSFKKPPGKRGKNRWR